MAGRGVFTFADGDYVAVTEVHLCVGYWVYADEPTVRLVPGYPFSMDEHEVWQGWNLFAVPWARPVFSDPLVQGSFWLWNAAELRYEAATKLLPGYAYWFLAPTSGLLDPPGR